MGTVYKVGEGYGLPAIHHFSATALAKWRVFYVFGREREREREREGERDGERHTEREMKKGMQRERESDGEGWR